MATGYVDWQWEKGRVVRCEMDERERGIKCNMAKTRGGFRCFGVSVKTVALLTQRLQQYVLSTTPTLNHNFAVVA